MNAMIDAAAITLALTLPFTAQAQATAATLNATLRADLILVEALIATICTLGQLYYFSAAILEAIKGGSIWTVVKYVAICLLLPVTILSYSLFQ